MIDPNRNRRVDVRLLKGMESRTLPKELAIVGPAGTGKTYGILQVIHALAADYPGFRAAICRQTRSSLTESVLATFEDEILPADNHEFIASGERRDHRTAYRYPNGSRIVLGGLDKPERILSTAWDLVFINEAIETQVEPWETILSRMSRPGRSSRWGYLIGDLNPGDPNHYIKKRADAGIMPLWETTHAANPALFDANGWTPAWDRYREQLGKLTGTRRKRLLEGLWVPAEGQWFETFDTELHVHPSAEFDPTLPVHLAVDCGVHTGAVWFQIRGDGDAAEVTVFADYYSDRMPAYQNALAIQNITMERCRGHVDVGRMDPAGNSDNGTGLVIAGEYRRAGLNLKPWPKYPGCVASGLALVESFVAVDPPRLKIHPRCHRMIDAFANYRRKKRGNQWIDEPEDPQHPHEELMDSLRSGLLDKFPGGRAAKPKIGRAVHPHSVMY